MKTLESTEQIQLMRWVAYQSGTYPELDLLYHVPNGGSRNKIEAHNLKLQGVKAGVPDLCLPVARGKYHGLYIEMKVGNNKPSEHQKKWLQALREQNYRAEVAYGWEAASKILMEYIKS